MSVRVKDPDGFRAAMTGSAQDFSGEFTGILPLLVIYGPILTEDASSVKIASCLR